MATPRSGNRRTDPALHSLYYYTSEPEHGQTYDARTDFQSVVRKDLPISAP